MTKVINIPIPQPGICFTCRVKKNAAENEVSIYCAKCLHDSYAKEPMFLVEMLRTKIEHQKIAEAARDFVWDKTGIGFCEILIDLVHEHYGLPPKLDPEASSPYFPPEGQ